MPRVPYTSVSEAGLQSQATPSLSVNAPAGAFGAEVAQALGQLGGQIEKSSDEIFARAVAMQTVENESMAREADVKFMEEAGLLHAEYSSLQGKDKVAAYPTYIENLKATREKIKGSLSNPAVQRMYDAQTAGTIGRTIFSGAGEAATASRQYATQTAAAQMELDTKAVEDDPNDDVLFQSKLRRVQENAAELAALKGLDPDGPQARLVALEATSKLQAQRILGMAKTDPFKAGEWLDKSAGRLTVADKLRVEAVVQTQRRSIGSANIARDTLASGLGDVENPPKTLDEMEAEARRKAKALSPNDPLIEEQAATTLRTLYRADKYDKRQQELTDQQTVLTSIASGGIRTEQDLRADPAVSAAMDRLPKQARMAIPGQINSFNAARDKATNQETFIRLYGLSNNDVEAFLNTDVTKEKLSQQDMRTLLRRQQQYKERISEDPRVGRAMGWMRGSFGAQMEALGVYSRTADNKDEYDKLTGTVQSALDTFMEDNKRPPTGKEFNEQIAPEILKQRTVPGKLFGNLWPSKQPFYAQEVPDSFKEKITQEVVAAGGETPTPEQIYKAYVRAEWIRLYGKKETPK